MRNRLAIVAALLTTSPCLAGPSPLVGIGNGGCTYPSIGDALAAARSGDRLYVSVGTTYMERLVVDRDVEIVAATSDCRMESSSRVTVNGSTLAPALHGGVLEVTNGARVTLDGIELRSGNAQGGGLAYVTEDAVLTMRDALISGGTADGDGGCVLVKPGRLVLDGVHVQDCSAGGAGGGIAVGSGRLDLTGESIVGGTFPNVAATDGGGVFVRGGVVAITASQVSHNEAIRGGGIFASGSDLILTDASIAFNSAVVSGGGIHLEDDSLLQLAPDGTEPTVIDSNSVTGTTGDEAGGGIYSQASTVAGDGAHLIYNQSSADGGALAAEGGGAITLTGPLFLGNDAADDGGAIRALFATVTLEGGSLLGNTAGAVGGGLYGILAKPTLRGVEIGGNQAATGGGVSIQSDPNPVVLESVLFSENEATFSGGGAYFYSVGDVELRNVRFLDNVAGDSGGGFGTFNSSVRFGVATTGAYGCDPQALPSGERCSEVTRNVAGSDGGGVQADQADLVLDGVHLTSNEADCRGGGIHLEDGASAQIASSRLQTNQTLQNLASCGGGAIHLEAGTAATLEDTTVTGNHSARDGGGLYLAPGGSWVALLGSGLAYGSAARDGGGGWLGAGSILDLDRSTIIGNLAQGDGGGLAADGAELTAVLSNVYGNFATNGAGAALAGGSTAVFENAWFDGNQATGAGGGLFLADSDATLRARFFGRGACPREQLSADQYCVSFTDNYAGTSGGGIHAVRSDSPARASLTVEEGAFVNNSALDSGAGVHLEDLVPGSEPGVTARLLNTLFRDHGDAGTPTEAVRLATGSSLTLDSSTLAGNPGPGIVAEGAGYELTILRSILWDNGFGPFAGFNGTFSYSCIDSELEQAGSRSFGLGVDPVFVTTARGGYRLHPTESPLIDACPDGPPIDLDGGGRPGREQWDPGAFEVDPTDAGALFSDGFESGGTGNWSGVAG